MTTDPNATESPAGDPRVEDRLARAALSRCCEPDDAALAVVVATLGPVRVWELIRGDQVLDEEVTATETALAQAGMSRRRGSGLRAGLDRWRSRGVTADPRRDLEHAWSLGGGYLIPGDPAWPVALEDLGPECPLGLWWRGPGIEALAGLGAGPFSGSRLLSVVGTRDPSAYGIQVTTRHVEVLREHDVCILSGGALGIDITAHRSALDAGHGVPATICVLAGGVDRLYPATNSALLSVIARRHLILSEHPPGSAPTRWRFLARNRIIAALGVGTLVTEGRWRSGALNTANKAAELGRWVGAVPGPVTSDVSELPHRLIRESGAELISEPHDVIAAHGWDTSAGAGVQDILPIGAVGAPVHVTDALDPVEARLWESLPVSRSAPLSQVISAAGLAVGEALAGLHRLGAKGAAEEVHDGQWRRGRA
jgi:DNA processing protein